MIYYLIKHVRVCFLKDTIYDNIVPNINPNHLKHTTKITPSLTLILEGMRLNSIWCLSASNYMLGALVDLVRIGNELKANVSDTIIPTPQKIQHNVRDRRYHLVLCSRVSWFKFKGKNVQNNRQDGSIWVNEFHSNFISHCSSEILLI